MFSYQPPVWSPAVPVSAPRGLFVLFIQSTVKVSHFWGDAQWLWSLNSNCDHVISCCFSVKDQKDIFHSGWALRRKSRCETWILSDSLWWSIVKQEAQSSRYSPHTSEQRVWSASINLRVDFFSWGNPTCADQTLFLAAGGDKIRLKLIITPRLFKTPILWFSNSKTLAIPLLHICHTL